MRVPLLTGNPRPINPVAPSRAAASPDNFPGFTRRHDAPALISCGRPCAGEARHHVSYSAGSRATIFQSRGGVDPVDDRGPECLNCLPSEENFGRLVAIDRAIDYHSDLGKVPAGRAARFAGFAQPDPDRPNPLAEKKWRSRLACERVYALLELGLARTCQLLAPETAPDGAACPQKGKPPGLRDHVAFR